MTDTDLIELKNISAEDIGDVLFKIEKSFEFKFGKTELLEVKTFGELCDIIVGKMCLENVKDCTTQQAFYRLRTTISETLFIDQNSVNINTELKAIFKRASVRHNIKQIEMSLGFPLKILRPKY